MGDLSPKKDYMSSESDTIAASKASSSGKPDGIPLEQLNTAPSVQTLHHSGKRILTEEDEEGNKKLAYSWSSRKKWLLLTVVAICQTSMNFNAAIYSNAVEGINGEFHTTKGRQGMIAFLVAYAFGCELWAPWSEELGRFLVMQVSLSFVNVSILICGLSNSFGLMMAGRVIGGLSSAGGSVTLGMVADMFHSDEQQHAVLWASLWSCLGAVCGGIAGGPIQDNLHWRWIFWVQLIFGVVTQMIHGVIAKESRATTLLDKEAKRLRKEEGKNVYGPNEVKTFKERWNYKQILATMWRPYRMLITEPIVTWLSLLSGFADALIFMFFESYGIVFSKWNFTPTQTSLVLLALGASYFISYFSFFPFIARDTRRRKTQVLKPETRLWWLLFLVVLLPVGLAGSAGFGTRSWIGVLCFTVPIGIANYAIYYATIDYMVECYGEYSASATGGNGFARDFLAGMCAIYTKPMFERLGVQNTYILLCGLSVGLCIPVFIFYWKGPAIRKRSKFAERLAAQKEHVAEVKHGAAGGDLLRQASPDDLQEKV